MKHLKKHFKKKRLCFTIQFNKFIKRNFVLPVNIIQVKIFFLIFENSL